MESGNNGYQLRFQQNSKIALVLVVVPIVGVLLMLFPLAFLNVEIPEWGLFTIIMIGIIFIVGFTIYLVINKTVVDCNVTINADGFRYELQGASFMYPRKIFFSTWDNISNISDSTDTKSSLTFYQVGFISPAFTATFNFRQGYESDVHFFWSDLQRYKNHYNIQHGKMKRIGSKNFYDAGWAWLLTQLIYLMLLSIAVIKFNYPDLLSWWRITGFVCFALIWLVNYHTNRKQKNNQSS
ncbi:hypothetical protein LK994_10190 [Ferruginibacter lapsinanis]|uniref:hypothetical protein n=1 Tax=Ferruginibacter lapsinanis TaxID=563172 RepID=UPI001E588317|nr:hypothetical protein [Ferruginibacter lapsinanis]UEG49005.1 hypothetical protein LK994_10190 [Ferruginibacter lapsinanis]